MIGLTHTLEIQRQLLELPLGPERFDEYLHVMTGGTDEILLPLGLFNPMGKEHVMDTVDALISMEAESIAIEAIDRAKRRLNNLSDTFQIALVVIDDLKGGWTNRYSTDADHRFKQYPNSQGGWAVAPFWTSELQSIELVNERVLENVYRVLYKTRYGHPATLREMMVQEGISERFAGKEAEGIDHEELDYSRKVLEPHLNSDHYPTIFACLYGDNAAKEFGYTPLGLSEFAGFEVALTDAIAHTKTPEEIISIDKIRRNP
jgi:hypothetical protein